MLPWHYPALPSMSVPPRSPLEGLGEEDAGRCFLVTSRPATPWSFLFEPQDTDAVLAEFHERETPGFQLVEVVEKRALLPPGPACPAFEQAAVQGWLDGFWAAEAAIQRAALRDPDLAAREWLVGYGALPLGGEAGGKRVGELFFAPGEAMARELAERYQRRVGGYVLLGRLRRVDPSLKDR